MYVVAAAILLAIGAARWLFYGSAEAFGRMWAAWDRRRHDAA